MSAYSRGEEGQMTSQAEPGTPARNAPVSSPRKRHWWRWVLASAAALVAVAVAAVALFITSQPVPPPLALPTARADTPTGPLGGTWAAGPGSVAGFRVRETALGFSSDVVGRTHAVTGTMAISGEQATQARFRIGLATVTVNGKTQPQFAASLDTRAYPVASFTLTRPVTLAPGFASGATTTTAATGQLTMRGNSHRVTVTISFRRDGPELQAAGSFPVAFSGWGIKEPGGFGPFGSLADHGIAEFRLVLHRATHRPPAA
jgi:polyisoprenoid-binding protein YceI